MELQADSATHMPVAVHVMLAPTRSMRVVLPLPAIVAMDHLPTGDSDLGRALAGELVRNGMPLTA